MKSETNDIYEMLDTLSLPVAAQRFAELSKSPEFGSYTALQFIREVLEPQYIETLNNCFLQALFPQKCRLTSSKLHGEFPHYCISSSGTLSGAGEESLQAYKVY